MHRGYRIFTFFEVLNENNTIRLRALFTRCEVAVQVIWKPVILFFELIGWPLVFFVAGLGLGSIKNSHAACLCNGLQLVLFFKSALFINKKRVQLQNWSDLKNKAMV